MLTLQIINLKNAGFWNIGIAKFLICVNKLRLCFVVNKVKYSFIVKQVFSLIGFTKWGW